MSLYRRGSVWWSRIVRHGERLDRSTKKRNKTDAIRVEAKWLSEIAEAGEDLSSLRAKPLTLRELSERFEKFADAGGVAAPRTRAFYKDALKPLINSSMGNEFIGAITPAKIAQWIEMRANTVIPPRTKGVGPARINASLRALRRALKLAEEWGLLKKCPKIKILPGERSRDFVITEEMLERMLAHEKCTPTLNALIPFLIDTGLRLSEALALTWMNVGLDPKPGASMGWVQVVNGKSKYAKRHVPLTQRAHNILETLKQQKKGYLLFSGKRKNTPLSRHWASEQFRELRIYIGLSDDCVIHSCRHTFCTRLGEAGAEAFTIQKLAGHSSVLISQRYTHPSPERLEMAVAKMSSVFAAPESTDGEIEAKK